MGDYLAEETVKNLIALKQPSFVIDSSAARFPQCVVWTPLPIVSWLAPFFGHVGICRDDGAIMDFSGSYFVNIDNFTFGTTARYVRIDVQQCCFPPHLSGHTCKSGYNHAQLGTALSWDDGVRCCMQHFQHKAYNLFMCNCHSFVANCLNRVAYQRCMKWNVVRVVLLVFMKGQWVSKWALAKSFGPCAAVMCLGFYMAGWFFLGGWAVFNLLLYGWYIFATYITRGLIDC